MNTSEQSTDWNRNAVLELALDRMRPWRWAPYEYAKVAACVRSLVDVLDELPGTTVQDHWDSFEASVWPRWLRGNDRPKGVRWRWGTWALVLACIVRPSWPFISTGRIGQWTKRLPSDHYLRIASAELTKALGDLGWVDAPSRERGLWLGVRIMLANGLTQFNDITDDHLRITGGGKGMDALDGALCGARVLDRNPVRGSTRWARQRQNTPAELVDVARIPERFRAVTIEYLEMYRVRVAPVYSTMRAKSIALGHWWRYIDREHPEIASSADIRPQHARGFLVWAKERAREVRRRSAHDDGTHERATAHVWSISVRLFFADLATWSTEDGSPFAGLVPPANPLGSRDLVSLEPAKIKRQTRARITATVLELERELPKIRAYAFRQWQNAPADGSEFRRGQGRLNEEASAFWDWALLELLILSGLRIEEACELTTLDVLRRKLPDGRKYYLLHVKPSKYDRARVIPIGDGLGRVIADIVRRVRSFYGSRGVPAIRAWDSHEKQWRPSAPYLLQTAAGHPSVIDESTIRVRLARLSRGAQAQRSSGEPLILRPHDCRRMFASEHLNNSTPPHVIQALLGHATIDTVLIYAKLYPSTLVEEYRKTLHGVYRAHIGDDAFKNPTADEWAALNQACAMRDMGTHLCALPTGEHCPKGLVCLGCGHAQPKKSAVPIFRGMLTSHIRILERGREIGEPAGQIAARELEVERIRGALRRAEELSDDVAAAIEATADPDQRVSESQPIFVNKA